ncbi:MAG: DEAD/DEAH box helicase [Acidimicrobiales bacterium]|nr:DEAD/DEAH box helicase [Acidimicrobiales bacterium]
MGCLRRRARRARPRHGARCRVVPRQGRRSRVHRRERTNRSAAPGSPTGCARLADRAGDRPGGLMSGPVVVEAAWSDGCIALWGRTTGPMPRRRPPSASRSTLLGTLGDGPAAARSAEVPLLLARPGGRRPETQVVPALLVDPASALPWLLGLLDGDAPVSRWAADSLRWVLAVAALADDLAAAGAVAPGLVLHDDGRAEARWWPVPGAGEVARLRALVASVPASVAGGDRATSTAEILGALVDAACRARLDGVRLDPPRARPRRGPDERVTAAWLTSLIGADPVLASSPGFPLDRAALERLLAEVSAWVRSGLPDAGPVRLVLRLEPPPEAEAGAATETVGETGAAVETVGETGLETGGGGGGQRWWLEYLVQPASDPSLLLPLGRLWATGRRVPRAVGRLRAEVPDLDERVLGALGRAVRLCPDLAASLDVARPEGADLAVEEAHRFLVAAAPLLEQAGIGVLLPSWWLRRPRLGARLHARSSAASPPGTTAVTASGLDLLAAAEFSWEVALGEEALTEDELDELAAAKAPLVRVRGQWVELGPGDLAAARRLLERPAAPGELAELVRLDLGLPGAGAGLAAGPGDLPVLGVRAEGWLASLLDDVAHQRVEPVPTPSGFHGELRPYQERGVGWLGFLGRLGLGACLADDMGLGKTPQLLAHVVADPVGGPTLVVSPMSVLGNWQREAERFTPALRVEVHHGSRRRVDPVAFAERAGEVDVVLTTYALLARDAALFAAVAWGRVVLDEAQYVKNPGTKQAQAVRRLSAGRRVALTGTPVENRLSELWALMDVLNPGLLGSATAFRERFAVPIERHRDDEAAELLRRVTRPFVLRRLKTDRTVIADLPDKLEFTERCSLTREQASLYRAVVDEMLRRADEAEGQQRRGVVLAGLTRLKQVCNHPAQLLADGSPLVGRSGKLARVEELLEEVLAAGERALCFTQFAAWGHLLAPYLERRLGEQVLWLHGGVRKAARDELVDRFQAADGPPVLVVSLKAGGTGLNLTAANHVVHLDRWWNPAVEDQATDRAYRIGQRRQVQVRTLVCMGTVEERIDALMATKRALADRVVGTGERWLTELGTDELRELVVLSADAVAEAV